tara:strand:+ start:516 stop:1859 length:1344 start_codon:yes stop_codon:yes gene_type:complete
MKQIQNQSVVQRLALTQQMRNSLHMLKMGSEELIDAAEQEAKRNPFLRLKPALHATGNTVKSSVECNTGDIPENPSNNEDIINQISLIRLNSEDSRIAKELVYCMDERGYLTDTIDDMSGYLDTPKVTLSKLVAILQKSVEPAGIFAWSLKDSFRIQLEAQNKYDSLIAKLLDRLDLVALQKLDEIASLCKVDLEDAQDMLDDIRALNPAPLLTFNSNPEPSRAPDLIFDFDKDGKILTRLNDLALPKILTDDAMFSSIKAIENDQYASTYYQDCYRGAAGFIIAMQKRANTLLQIGQTLAKRQEKFILTGRKLHRKPFTMMGLAEELGLNKSTVSRALRNCMIETPRGIINPIDLFVRPLNQTGNDRTRDQVLQRLSVLIRTENKSSPFSDEELARQLMRANIPISRRTVAKYRAMIDIEGAYDRRKVYVKGTLKPSGLAPGETNN